MRCRFSIRKCSGLDSPWNQNSTTGAPVASGPSTISESLAGRITSRQPSHRSGHAPMWAGYSGEFPSVP